MKERPILFSAPMVRAILEGRKTQTRRVVKPQPPAEFPAALCDANGLCWWWNGDESEGWPQEDTLRCPYGAPGDRLWVRETFWCDATSGAFKWYVNDIFAPDQERDNCRLKPGIHMRRSESRLALEVVSMRVERVQEISDKDAVAEGVEVNYNLSPGELSAYLNDSIHVDRYARLWESINFKRGHGWNTNPWVWVVEFKRIEDGRSA